MINHKVVTFFQSIGCGTYNYHMLAGFLFEIKGKRITYIFCACEENLGPLIYEVAKMSMDKGLETESQVMVAYSVEAPNNSHGHAGILVSCKIHWPCYVGSVEKYASLPGYSYIMGCNTTYIIGHFF